VEAGVDADNLTVSEAHGYGMMLAALMAGHDPQARTVFDGMYAYFRAHPTATHSHLMSWYQNDSCADAEGNDSASDGDLDIAYALLLADRQWGSCGPVDYRAEALNVIADLKDGDLAAGARWVLLGDWVTPADDEYYPSTRSSDFMPDHYRTFWALTGDGAWQGLVQDTYGIVAALQAAYSPTTGLLPDFVVSPITAPHPAPAHFLEGRFDGAYGYNACRVPWRLATDFLITGDPRARTAVQRMNAWVRAETAGDPSGIRSGYRLDGSHMSGTNYLSMAFVAPFGVGAMVDPSNQAWLEDVWDLVAGTPITAEGYYENTIKLLSMIVMSGNWWAPQPTGGGCEGYAPAPCE
jgi:endo-1,4-beta-D-glucanase Y